MPLKLKRKFLLWLFATLIIWIAAGFIYQIIRNEQRKAQNLVEKIGLQTSKKAGAVELAAQINELQEKVNEADRFLLGPDQEDVVKFIEILEKINETAGVEMEISSIEVPGTNPIGEEKNDEEGGAQNPDANFENLILKIKTRGGWSETYRFLAMLESLPFRIVIAEVSFELGALNSSDFTEDRAEKVDIVWEGEFIFEVAKTKK